MDRILPLVRKPGQYIGGELHASNGHLLDNHLNFCLVFPDLYEIGMSHQGLQILYHILNNMNRVAAHRCYVPDIDMETKLRDSGVPLFSLEGRFGLSAYDVLGITLPHELCYTNILTILDLAGLPFRASRRNERHPLVLGGGPCAFNPEPVADFFDAVVLGDGEEIIVELAELLLQGKDEGWSRAEVLAHLASIAGVYVPGFFTPRYEQGRLIEIRPLQQGYSSVRKRVLAKLPPPFPGHKPLVPVVKPVHDRLGIEVARGCTRGCRFCQAGMTYRPVRERSLDEVIILAEQGIAAGGFEELALLSLSTGDFSCLGPLMTELMDRFADTCVSVSMPSMRVGTLTPEIMEEVKRVRKSGFTIAPEAGSDRLRQIINKGITEDDLMATCRDAFFLGWNLIKLYFMVGLPTETEKDIEAIVDLAKKIRSQTGQRKGRPVQVNIGVATFIPKPHTPFQWEAQLSLDESKRRIDRLKQLLPRHGFKLKWHDPRQSFLEGVFARGDRRLARLVETAWSNGVRLDSWSEHYSLEQWRRAAAQCDIDLEEYLRRRTTDEVLPWDHLHTGVERTYLEEEYNRALAHIYTPDCRVNGCQGCGLCDFESVQPVVFPRGNALCELSAQARKKIRGSQQQGYTCRVRYTRCGDSRFYGHLELLQLVFRALRRAEVPVVFSSGFNPSPRVAFSQALPVGVESLAEFFDVVLARPPASLQELKVRLNHQLPATIRVTEILFPVGKPAQSTLISYEMRGPCFSIQELQVRVAAFLARESFPVERLRKNRRQTLDLRPLVRRLEVGDTEVLLLDLLSHHGQPAANPREILEKVLGLSREEALLVRILKTKMVEMAALS
nr:TIGR03960 family B12-binding radical SAM protein [Desulfobulbus alkaliphilus]